MWAFVRLLCVDALQRDCPMTSLECAKLISNVSVIPRVGSGCQYTNYFVVNCRLYVNLYRFQVVQVLLYVHSTFPEGFYLN